jgi:predicted TIM-barrel fold metal-dependent hydrolase
MSGQPVTEAPPIAGNRSTTGIVDCDVHNGLRSRDELKQYLPKRFHRYYDDTLGWNAYRSVMIMQPRAGIFRHDSVPGSGAPPASDIDFLRQQLLDTWNIERAVLSPLEALDYLQHGEEGHALASATNDWLVDRWLNEDSRFRGSIMVPCDDPARAAAEIARMSPDQRFVQVMMLVEIREPLGSAKYWPMLEAAAAEALPVAIHVGGVGGHQSTNGQPTYYFERRATYTHAFQAHVVSLVTSGVFERFPQLKIVIEEGGIVWMPSLMWRLDRAWEAMGDSLRDLKRRPSDVIRDHFWFTTQPIDDPEKVEYWQHALDQLAMDDRIMFASDYPHWDFDAPDRAIPATFPRELRQMIYSTNAEALYRFNSA